MGKGLDTLKINFLKLDFCPGEPKSKDFLGIQ